MGKPALISLPEGTKVPDHIAMILDGNRRWARARGLQPWEGHKAGYAAVKYAARAARQMGVHTFTVWSFSTENWDRAEVEVKEIFNILRMALKEIEKELHDEKVRLVHLGRKDRFPDDLVESIAKLEKDTAHYEKHILNIALDYGGKDEILRAIKKLVADKLPMEKLNEDTFADYLDTAGQPYPYVDLFIRTSGEQRTSGLLPWQMAYAEYFWEYDHLPDFTPEKLKEAVLDYSRRRRRFGGNDSEAHLTFDPKLVAGLEVKWRHELALGDSERLRDLVRRYVEEHYGLSKELAKTAGMYLVQALKYRRQKDWDEAKVALNGLYEIVRKSVGLALEPEIVAHFEVRLWRDANETDMRKLLSEKFRFSDFQASKSAHLAFMADTELENQNWDKAKLLLEKYYQTLKERVA